MVLSPRNKYQFSPPVCGGLHRLSSRRHVNHTCHSCSLHHTFHGRYFPRVAGDSRRDKANTINKVQSGIAHVYQVIEICHRSLPVVELRNQCLPSDTTRVLDCSIFKQKLRNDARIFSNVKHGAVTLANPRRPFLWWLQSSRSEPDTLGTKTTVRFREVSPLERVM